MRLRSLPVILIALVCAGAPQAAEGDIWRLQKIVAVNELGPQFDFGFHWVDSRGGLVEVVMAGTTPEKCPNGTEHVQFTWDFERVDELVEGAAFPIRVAANGTGYEPCAVFAAQSFISPAGSKGITWALPRDEMERVDQDRFYDTGPGETRSYPSSGEISELYRDMMLAAYDPIPGRPLAYFEIRMVVFGAPGELRIVYVYSKDEAPMASPTWGEPLPQPG